MFKHMWFWVTKLDALGSKYSHAFVNLCCHLDGDISFSVKHHRLHNQLLLIVSLVMGRVKGKWVSCTSGVGGGGGD